jgi:type II secretory pathway predicted ATPase ExeA
MSDITDNYEQHWQMPFSRATGKNGFYHSWGHQEALARLSMMVNHQYLGVITGEIGSGKSTILRHFTGQLDPTLYQPVYLKTANLKPRDFYSETLRSLGEEISSSLVKARRIWTEVLETRCSQKDKSLVIIIDEAQDMNESMLLELRFIMNHQMDSVSLFPLILAGQPELRRTLRLKKYEAISQRVQLQYHLSGLSKDETFEYVKHRMKNANFSSPMFAESALLLIYSATQGIPRIINLVCTQALYEAFQKKADVIEENHVGRILADMDRQRGAIV